MLSAAALKLVCTSRPSFFGGDEKINGGGGGFLYLIFKCVGLKEILLLVPSVIYLFFLYAQNAASKTGIFIDFIDVRGNG